MNFWQVPLILLFLFSINNFSLEVLFKIFFASSPARPQWLTVFSIYEMFGMYHNRANISRITVFAGEQQGIFCQAVGARPPVVLTWELPEDMTAFVGEQSDDVKEDNYISRKVAMFTPSRSDQGKSIRCKASHPELTNYYQEHTIYLDVQGPPDAVNIEMDDLKEGTQTNVICTAYNGYPPPLIHWHLGSTNLTDNSSRTSSLNPGIRFEAESSLVFTPHRSDHGKLLVCQAVHPTASGLWSLNSSMLLNISYPPVIVDMYVQRLQDDRKIIKILLECKSDANPPDTNFSWFHNDTMIRNSSQSIIYPDGPRNVTITTSFLVIHNAQPTDVGKYECQVTTNLGSASASTRIGIPDAPSHFVVNRNKTKFSTLSVAWQPGFDGGLSQTFSLEYCRNDPEDHDGCDVVSNLVGTTYNLTGLTPFTLYRMTLRAVNDAGTSSAVLAEDSTAPLAPESYGIIITWDRASKVLTFSNGNRSFTDLCLLVPNASRGDMCPSVMDITDSECVKPGSNDTIHSPWKPVVVTFGRGLCSDPANVTVVERPSPSYAGNKWPIVLGLTSISVGLICFCGLLCCLKRRKEGEVVSERRKGERSESIAQQVSQGEYTELEGYQEAKYESLSFHTTMKSISSTRSTTVTTVSSSKPLTSGKGTSDYVNASVTGKDQEPLYFSADDLTDIDTGSKIPRDQANAVTTHSTMSKIKSGEPAVPHSYGSSGSEGRDVSSHLTLGENGRRVDGVKSVEPVYTNTERDEASKQELEYVEPYINTVPTATKDDADGNMGMTPLPSTISRYPHFPSFNPESSLSTLNEAGDKMEVHYENTEEMTSHL